MASMTGSAEVSPRQSSPRRPTQDDHFDTITSKRSVEKIFYPHEPSFFKPFVPKFKRRPPLVNRGYWLRMKAIDAAMETFLQRPMERKRVIVNLGCGYDPLPFRCHGKGLVREGVKFVDVDVREIIEEKVKLTINDKHMRTLLDSWSYNATDDSDDKVILRSEFYDAVGCNFNDVDNLRHIFIDSIPVHGYEVMFLVEDAFLFMKLRESAALIEWASSLENAHFCLLGLSLANSQGPFHPFLGAMTGEISKQGHNQPSLHLLSLDEQQDRFYRGGWSSVHIQSLWHFWQNPASLSQDELLTLNKSELFDDWEEFVLFAGHHFILQASTTALAQPDVPKFTNGQGEYDPPKALSISKTHISGKRFPKISCGRRFSAPLVLSAESVVLQGGIPGSRDFELYTSSSSVTTAVPPNISQPLSHHTISAASPTQHLLVGGRFSQTKVSPQCSIYDTATNSWTRVHDITPERYRHCAAPVCVGTDRCVVVFGGRDSNGKALDDWQLWDTGHGWRKLKCSNGIRPRFGASMIATGNANGLVLGGMDETGRILEDSWEWSINHQLEVICTPVCLSGSKNVARFGATLVSSRWGILLVGGVSSEGVIPQTEDILVIQNDGTTRPLNPILSEHSSWPLLVGASVAAVSGGDVLIVGGGAVCFSSGTFTNNSWYTIQDAAPTSDPSDRDIKRDHETLPHTKFRRLTKDELYTSESTPIRTVLSNSGEEYQELKLSQSRPPRSEATFAAVRSFLQDFPGVEKVPSQTISDTTDISSLLENPHPVNFLLPNEPPESSPNDSKWTLDHLTAKIGSTTKVSIHESQGPHMKFAGAGRNIEYTTLAFGHFATLLAHGHHCYLRALSASHSFDRPADFWRDFPGLAQDFAIPPVLDRKFAISAPGAYHSAVLRVSGDVSMWVHYDVMANLLFQLAGAKQVLLFPPRDALRLGFAPGKTASPLNVFEQLEARGVGSSPAAGPAAPQPSQPLDFLRGATPHALVLEAGRALYIPRFWAHATAPDAPGRPSVAVNVFWRDLPRATYSLRKDVYGSLDLRCYEAARPRIQRAAALLCEQGRQDESVGISDWLRTGGSVPPDVGGRVDLAGVGLLGLREAVRAGVPEDVSDFYLLRLSDEFERLVNEDVQHRVRMEKMNLGGPPSGD